MTTLFPRPAADGAPLVAAALTAQELPALPPSIEVTSTGSMCAPSYRAVLGGAYAGELLAEQLFGPTPAFELTRLRVEPLLRRRGVATALLDAYFAEYPLRLVRTVAIELSYQDLDASMALRAAYARHAAGALTSLTELTRGDRVVLPVGTEIETRGEFKALTRVQRVSVWSTDPGSGTICWPGAGGYWRTAYVGFGVERA